MAHLLSDEDEDWPHKTIGFKAEGNMHART